MKILHIVTFFITIFSITSCSSCQNDLKYVPKPAMTDVEYCPSAEENLLKICPSYAAQTKKMKENNETFKNFCKRKAEEGVFFNPKCISTASSCEEVDICTGSK